MNIMNIKSIIHSFKKQVEDEETNKKEDVTLSGWVRTVRSSSANLTFCVINDGSNVNGLQVILTNEIMDLAKKSLFEKEVKTGAYIKCIGKLVKSPGEKQVCEMQLHDYELSGKVDSFYPLAKSKMNLDTLRQYIHFRPRTNVFGSVFRIRSKLMKAIHDFYHHLDFHHIDPNIITINECEGGAGVFQLTEKDISKKENLEYSKEGDYKWLSDHFNDPVYLTVSSQLQLEIFACGLGNCYTVNKSFRSEHSNTNKHASEFTHLEIEMINNNLDDLMNIGEQTIKYCIERICMDCSEDIDNLDAFISKGLKERLSCLLNKPFIKKTYQEVIEEINIDINNKVIDLPELTVGDDLGSKHEDYITQKYNNGVFVTHWPLAIKSFYMKKCIENDNCESFDLLLPFGIGEIIGASQREDNYDQLLKQMDAKGIMKEKMGFYIDLRKYGSCPHGGFGLGFERLLMLMTGMKNIRDVLPIPVCYKDCKY